NFDNNSPDIYTVYGALVKQVSVCEGYARAMAHDGAAVGLCSPGGEAVAKATGALLGVEATVIEKIAVVRCGGCDALAEKAYDYRGLSSCKAAMSFYGGDKACSFGCLGKGDCAAVCQYAAIRIENGIAVVDDALCKGCGQCATVCPKGIIAVVENPSAAIVKCSSHDKGAVARKVCKTACIGCMKCQKVCESGAITVTNFLAAVDPAKCTACGKCIDACPQGCIV
ncbi:MAG: 4Fe-4S binding protein, partial [Clostridia bacterium]|nr:4Fe-4S binding protein [Clostridia bacterium]